VTELECDLNLAQENIQSKAKKKAFLQEIKTIEKQKTKNLSLHLEIYEDDLYAADKRFEGIESNMKIK